MAKIYTRTGDKGKTGLFGGKRVKKCDPRINAYGTIDELNAVLGQAGGLNEHKDLDPLIHKIQNDLFDIGAVLASPSAEKIRSVGAEDIKVLEEAIDRHDRELPPLRNFILPGGSRLASALHLGRTVCRRAEREVVLLSEREAVSPEILTYMNRLSDLLFVLARWANLKEGVLEIPWEKKK